MKGESTESMLGGGPRNEDYFKGGVVVNIATTTVGNGEDEKRLLEHECEISMIKSVANLERKLDLNGAMSKGI